MVNQTARIVDAGIHAARAPKKVEVGAKKPMKGELLVETMYKKGVPALLADLWSAELRTRAYAAHALGLKADPKAVPGLVAAFRSENDWWVRVNIIDALERTPDKRVVPALIGMLKDENHYVKITAACALKKRNAPAVMKKLAQEIAQSRDADFIARASGVLAEISGI